MLGNDIVDLRDPESRPESFRPRFDERVFLLEERRAIERDRNPMARRWAHWAAKEAAFKLAKQACADFVFAPGQTRVHFEGPVREAGSRIERQGTAEWIEAVPREGLTAAEVRSFETADRVHVIALPAGADWDAITFAAEPLEDPAENPSEAVRRMAIREIARSLGISRHRLSIGRAAAPAALSAASPASHSASGHASDPSGPSGGDPGDPEARPTRIPTLEIDGAAADLSLSLSHHGRWVAFAMTPRTDLPAPRAVAISRGRRLAEPGAAEL